VYPSRTWLRICAGRTHARHSKALESTELTPPRQLAYIFRSPDQINQIGAVGWGVEGGLDKTLSCTKDLEEDEYCEVIKLTSRSGSLLTSAPSTCTISSPARPRESTRDHTAHVSSVASQKQIVQTFFKFSTVVGRSEGSDVINVKPHNTHAHRSCGPLQWAPVRSVMISIFVLKESRIVTRWRHATFLRQIAHFLRRQCSCGIIRIFERRRVRGARRRRGWARTPKFAKELLRGRRRLWMVRI